MKRHLSTIILTVLCLLSCSEAKDDIPSPNPDVPPTPDANMISFSSSDSKWQEGDTHTRATALEKLFKDFQVYGYKNTSHSNGQQNVMQTVIKDYKVQWNETANDWEYIFPEYNQQMKIWDYSAASYRFFAMAPYNHGAITNIESSPNEGEAYVTFTTKYDFGNQEAAKSTPYYSELWYSFKGATDASKTMPKIGEQVKLVFSPLIAKVRFRFTFATGVKAIITEPTFQDTRWATNTPATDPSTPNTPNTPNTPDTPMQWNIKVKYPTIKDAEIASTPAEGETALLATNIPTVSFSITPTENSPQDKFLFDTPFTDKSEKWYFVPPMADAPDAYKNQSFTLTAKIDGHEDTATVPAEYMQWKAGYQYTYVFKVLEAGTDIIFSDMQVEKWERNTPADNQGHGTGGW